MANFISIEYLAKDIVIYQKMLNNPEFSGNDQIAGALSTWQKQIETGIRALKESSKPTNDANDLKDHLPELSTLSLALSGIPPIIRKELTPEDIEPIANLLNIANNKVSLATSSVRNLPIKGNINIDISRYKAVLEDLETDEAIPIIVSQMNSLQKIVESIIEMPQLLQRHYTLQILNNMCSTF